MMKTMMMTITMTMTMAMTMTIKRIGVTCSNCANHDGQVVVCLHWLVGVRRELRLVECQRHILLANSPCVHPNAGVVISVVRGDVDQGQIEPPLEPTLFLNDILLVACSMERAR